ncbi:MAG: hypothetical protein DME15_16890 [Candidatus Rokuibacteriota bacterium]|nr:MAG: hypothetical protein DME15_16890 [Candidatus Rokubacteria bacterium]
MRPRRRVVYHWPVMADSKPAALGEVAATSFVVAAERVKPHAKLIALLALGHLVIDLNQGAIPAVLPFLRSAHGLSYAQAATIVLVANLTSSLIQPLFGYLSDQFARRWILPTSVFLSGAGVALIGIAPGYLTVLGLVLVMGLGVAAWHPEGYKTATGVAGVRKATALSWFSLGGNLGLALGPPVITSLVTGLSIAGTLGMLAPTVVVGGLILAVLPHIDRATVPRAVTAASVRGTDMPGAMALLIFLVAIRAWAQLGFTTFVPFYYVDYLKADPRLVGPLLFVFLGAGAVLTSSFSVSIVLGQAYLPRNTGMASGLVVGFAIGAGGLGVAALGSVADHWGLPAALTISALMPLAGFVAARFLPAPRDFK